MRILSTAFFSFCVILFAKLDVVAQPEITKMVRANNIITRFTQLQKLNPGDVITGMSSMEESEVLGDTYWDKHWAKSSLLLYKNDELVEGYVIRYDIYKNEFEFNIQDRVRVLAGNKVKNVVWIDSVTNRTRYLINCKDFVEDNVSISGFLEILVEGEVNLIKKIRLEILKPDFSPALNVGSKDTRILKKESYYFSKGSDLTRIKSKKDVSLLFKDQEKQLESFIKKEGIKFNNESDLISLFTHFSGGN